MIIYRALFIVVFLMIATNARSQHRIAGFVEDTLQQRMAGAVVIIKSESRNTVRSIATDSTGKFLFQDLDTGRYSLGVSYVGYENVQVNLKVPVDTMLTIQMTARQNTLKTVTVNGTAPRFERKIDRFVFNVSGTNVIRGLSTFELLRQTPMLRADEQTGVSIMGTQGGVTVFLNRRKLNLSGNDLINFLRELPSEDIERIELLTIPPPFYDVDGPVIDIITKKLKTNGLIATLIGNYLRAHKDRGAASLSLIYNKNNFNQTTSISGSLGNSFREISKTTTFDPAHDTVSTYSAIVSNRRALNILNTVNYDLNQVWTLGTQALFNTTSSRGNLTGDENTNAFRQRITGGYTTLNGNVYLRYNSEKKGAYAELSADILHSSNKQTNEFNDVTDPLYLKTYVPQQIDGLSLKLDLSKKLKKEYMLEGGLKLARTDVKTPYELTKGSQGDGQYENNLFKYREYITSGYVSVAKEFSQKWSAKLGVKIENSRVNTTTNGNSNNSYSNNFTFIVPIGYLNYSPNSKNSFSITSRLNNYRPDFTALNPATIQIGPRTVSNGDPYLQPANGATFQFMHGISNKYYWGLNYTFSKNEISQVNTVLPPDTLLIQWKNWGNSYAYNAWFFTSQNMTREWEMSVSLNGSYYKRTIRETADEGETHVYNTQAYLSINNTLRNIFLDGLNFLGNVSGSTPSRFGVWKQGASYRIDIGSSYSIKKLGLQVSVMFNDITKYADRHLVLENITKEQLTSVINNNDQRSFYLSIAKSFGNLKTKKGSNRQTSNEDVRERL
jgi:hypothetical protein